MLGRLIKLMFTSAVPQWCPCPLSPVSLSPALLFLTLSQRLLLAGAAAAAAFSAAAQNVLVATRNEAISTVFQSPGRFTFMEKTRWQERAAHMEPKWRPGVKLS